ncbi:MAG: PQQ-binding-like beta-propeller repeat protein [Thaumarchaeota archaeon]|nr:PQQ-binding-like beta-propeller repeat protein [Nitrososphaerota archaeon]
MKIGALRSESFSGENWSFPLFDKSNTGFNPQSEINRENIHDLVLKWSVEIPSFPSRQSSPAVQGVETRSVVMNGIQTTPLVVNGRVYVADGSSTAYAFDAQTGTKKWMFQPDVSGVRGMRTVHTLSTYDGLVCMFAPNCILYGLDLESGQVKLSLKNVSKEIPGNKGFYAGRAAPSFYDRSAIMGPAGGGQGGRGFLSSYDLDSKRLNWRWFSAPPAEKGQKNWEKEAHKGNIEPYHNDWGTSDLAGGASIWGQTLVDEDSHRVYFGTGNSDLFLYDASLVPGPNLYAACIVSLDARTGEMLWYYQTTPHDLIGWAVGWNVILTDINMDGVSKKVVIAGAKNNHVYILDASNGKPVYEPVRVGHSRTLLNANLGNNADMKSSLKSSVYCPGHFGGIESPTAFANNTIFVASQRIDQEAVWYDGTYRERPMKRIELRNTDSPQYSTLYAVDAGRGEVKWAFFMPSPYHGVSITVSGGVVYAVDRAGILYALDEKTGQLLRKIDLGGAGAAGVSIGVTNTGEMRLFVAVSGRNGSVSKVMSFGLG